MHGNRTLGVEVVSGVARNDVLVVVPHLLGTSRLVVLPGGDALGQERLLESNGQALADTEQMSPDFARQDIDVLEMLQRAQLLPPTEF